MNVIADFEAYLRYEQRRSEETIEAYIRDLRQFVEYSGPADENDFNPRSVSANDIRRWLAHLATEGKTARSIRRKTQSLRAFFHYMMIAEGLNINPAADITLAKLPAPLPHVVPTGEMETLLNSPEPEKDPFRAALSHVVMTTLYATGIRRAELLSLTDDSVDFFKKELKVTGKRNKTRIIPLPDELLKEIREWQELRNETIKVQKPAGRLFCNRRGTFSNFSLAEIVRKALLPTSTARKSPHVIRHTFATSLLNGGADLNSVKELLGHASLTSTQIYTHLSFDELRKAYSSAHPRAHRDKTDETAPDKKNKPE